MSCLTADLRRALLAQVGCGIPDLICFLENEIDLIWETQDECTDRLRYLYTQLGLIEAAQIFARNQIDTMTREASSVMNERYSAFSTMRADAERDASGRSCSWAAATSSQHFNRDSEDQAIGWSDYRNKYDSTIDNSGFDKSCRHTTGFGFHRTNIASSRNVLVEERSQSEDTRQSEWHGGTGGLIPIYEVEWPIPTEVTSSFPYFQSVRPADPAVAAIEVPGSTQDLCPTPDDWSEFPLECRAWRYPSLGTGLNGNSSFTVSIPFVQASSITINWSYGVNYRQFFYCSSGQDTTHHEGTIRGERTETGATDASEDDNQTYSSEVTTIDHFVRKYGLTVRRATTDNDSEENAEGFSNGIAFSESNRDARAHAYAQSRAEAESEKHAESHFLKTDRANADMISKKYGQIGKHLKALWDRVWEHSMLLERQLAAKPYGGSMNCPSRSKTCLPVRRSYHDLRRVIQHV